MNLISITFFVKTKLLAIKIIDERLTLFNGTIDVYVLDSERLMYGYTCFTMCFLFCVSISTQFVVETMLRFSNFTIFSSRKIPKMNVVGTFERSK